MKRLHNLLFIIVTTLGIACSSPPPEGSQLLGPEAFQKALLETNDVQLVDVRTPQEFAIGHLQGALNIDFYGDGFEVQMLELNKKKPVFVYCHSGGRSGKAAQMLSEKGFKYIVDMDGGFSAWADLGLTVEE